MSVQRQRDRLIVALDLDHSESMSVARSLQGVVRWLKVGMTLYYEQGPEVVAHLRDMGFDIFLDLKLHDIPHQVEGAAEKVARLGVQMLTVHASGGPAMISAAVSGARKGARAAGVEAPAVIAVTVLTSMDAATLPLVGIQDTTAEQVERLATMAVAAGAAGVVCSPQEAAHMRVLLGESALVVTPGVRPAWSSTDDQARIATPASALQTGASHLVVGRPITSAPVPAEAAERIVQEMEGTAEWPT